jgi:hypothetical protein
MSKSIFPASPELENIQGPNPKGTLAEAAVVSLSTLQSIRKIETADKVIKFYHRHPEWIIINAVLLEAFVYPNPYLGSYLGIVAGLVAMLGVNILIRDHTPENRGDMVIAGAVLSAAFLICLEISNEITKSALNGFSHSYIYSSIMLGLMGLVLTLGAEILRKKMNRHVGFFTPIKVWGFASLLIAVLVIVLNFATHTSAGYERIVKSSIYTQSLPKAKLVSGLGYSSDGHSGGLASSSRVYNIIDVNSVNIIFALAQKRSLDSGFTRISKGADKTNGNIRAYRALTADGKLAVSMTLYTNSLNPYHLTGDFLVINIWETGR